MFEALRPYLPDIWLLMMAFFLLYYAITDGLDLGVGMISIRSKESEERGTMMGTIRSNWHSNQTWLVILGGMLFGAFPVFYGVILSGLYIPILVMLFGLLLRGVSFEMREHSEYKGLWDAFFGGGSLIASLAQGFALGGILSGYFIVENGDFAASHWGWLNPYSLLVTIGVLIGYVMLGANYLIMKTEGELQDKAYRIAWTTSLIVAPISIAVHIWTMFKYPYVYQKWTTFPDLYLLGGLTLAAAFIFIALLVSLKKRREVAPVFLNAALVIFSFAAVSVGLYPYMIPSIHGGIPVDEVAASPDTLMFMLYVSAVVLPIVLIYTSYEFWIYRGKTSKEPYGQEG